MNYLHEYNLQVFTRYNDLNRKIITQASGNKVKLTTKIDVFNTYVWAI